MVSRPRLAARHILLMPYEEVRDVSALLTLQAGREEERLGEDGRYVVVELEDVDPVVDHDRSSSIVPGVRRRLIETPSITRDMPPHPSS